MFRNWHETTYFYPLIFAAFQNVLRLINKKLNHSNHETQTVATITIHVCYVCGGVGAKDVAPSFTIKVFFWIR